MSKKAPDSPAEVQAPQKLISTQDAADRIGCSRSHIYTLVAEGKLRRFNIAVRGDRTKIRVADEDVSAYIVSAEAPIAHAEPFGGAA